MGEQADTLWVPPFISLVMACHLQAKISPFLPEVALVMLFATATDEITRPSMQKALDLVSSTRFSGVVVQLCNPSTGKRGWRNKHLRSFIYNYLVRSQPGMYETLSQNN